MMCLYCVSKICLRSHDNQLAAFLSLYKAPVRLASVLVDNITSPVLQTSSPDH